TLPLVALPDEIVEHRPTVCAACGTRLDNALVMVRERRQVHDLPTLRLRITEHQRLQLRCPVCSQVSAGMFPAAVPSRAQYGPRLRALAVYLVEQQLVPYARVRALLAEWLGTPVSCGTLVQWVQQGAAAPGPVEAQIKAALARVPVLH